MQRDLFGRMVAISMEQITDLERIFSSPITPIPTSLCHLDGVICKTEKSSLMKILRTDSNMPRHVDVVIVDGFFLFHCMNNVPQSFGNISKKILQILTSYNGKEVHIVFDRYVHPSIKDYERQSWGGPSTSIDYVIRGPDQTRSADFLKELRNDKFKGALVLFLIEHWATNEVAPFIGNKTIYLNFDECYAYEACGGAAFTTKHAELCCSTHEEADTKIIFHASRVPSDRTVVVKCSDTDIIIIMLGNIHNIVANIYVQCGVARSQHVIDVRALHERLGDGVCRSLPGLHAFTGCDYNPAFFRKGKTRPLNIVMKSATYQRTFAALGDPQTHLDELYDSK